MGICCKDCIIRSKRNIINAQGFKGSELLTIEQERYIGWHTKSITSTVVYNAIRTSYQIQRYKCI